MKSTGSWLGFFIRQQRAERSQLWLASAARSSNQAISDIEHGRRRPSSALRARLASALNVDAESLFQAQLEDEIKEAEIKLEALKRLRSKPLSVQPYNFASASPDHVTELDRMLYADPLNGDVIEVHYRDGGWSADVSLECPRCKQHPGRSQSIQAVHLADFLRELVRALGARRDELHAECPEGGH